MKPHPLLLASLFAGSLLIALPTKASDPTKPSGDFIFELTHVNQPDAEMYLVSKTNAKKYSEWQNPPVTYWGPSENGVDAELTYKFPLNQVAEKIHLVANLASFNFAYGRGQGTGHSSLWGSKDGKNWILLLDNPVPDRVDSYKTFDELLPKELLGGNEIWIQIRLRTEDAPNGSYTTAQFSRSSANSIVPVFYISTGDKPPKRASEAADPQQPKPAQPAAQKFDIAELIGDNLIDANGTPVNPATLKDKFIGIYFSASWCGPCRKFTPKLIEFRNQIADEFEVVFASADQDAPAMLAYMKEAGMPWPALPFGSPQISALNRTFEVRSIPTFIVLAPTGHLASPNARNDVTTLSPKDALSKWKNDSSNTAPPKPTLETRSLQPPKEPKIYYANNLPKTLSIQRTEAFNPAEMVAVKGGTLSEKSNLPGVEVDSFSIGKYEVTNAEWLAIQSFAQLNGYSFSKEPRTEHPELPIEGISRQEAMLWCNAKSEKEGLQPVYWLEGQIFKSPNGEPEMKLDANGYRLPTEPEWEWAARGGLESKGYQFSGSDNMDEVAWHGEKGEKWARPVGIKKPNELGIHDMAGNACEWVWDTNIPTYGIMGGCYMSSSVGTSLKYRSAGPLRNFAKEVGRARSLGFRVARNLSAETKPRLTPASFQLKAEESDPKTEPSPTQKVDLLGLVKKELVNAEGKPVDPATLDGKMIALYFSAHWCGPCKAFTPKLVEFANQAKDDVAVVFVSSDRDLSAMLSYMKEAGMPWPAIPFGSENAFELKRELHVSGIPALVVLNANGDVIAPRGRNDVDSQSPEACIQKWKNSEPQDPSAMAHYVTPSLFDRPAPPRPKNITIDPGKSIFGCAYGSSESDVIHTLGQPLGRSEYGGGITELIYGNDCALVFHKGRLSGASLIRTLYAVDLDSFSYSSPQHYFPNTYSGGWKLSNGIHPKMTTKEAIKILGEDIFSNNPHQITLNGQTIEFGVVGNIIHSLNIYDRKFIPNSRGFLNSPNFEFLPTNPKEHILGCKLGSDSKKIIESFGKPTTIFYFGDKKEGYLYIQDLLILFDGKLAGAQLDSHALTLTNGIQIGMPLSEAIAIVGENKIKKKWDNFSTISYLDGNMIVTLNSIDKERYVDWSTANERKKIPENLKISSIQIDPMTYGTQK